MKNGKTCFGVIIGTRAYFNSELAAQATAENPRRGRL